MCDTVRRYVFLSVAKLTHHVVLAATMTAMHAGAKRSYREMLGIERFSSSPASSRETSPLRRQSRQGSDAPGLQPTFDTPSNDWVEAPRKASFEADASVVLIGVRGVGKSSLGVLAATAYSRRLVETERVFLEATGTTTQAYRKLHGASEYHRKHYHILKRTLETHTQNCIIVCSFSDLEHHGSTLLREYAQSHPIIHITRDVKGIQSHLQVWSLERSKQLLCASGPLLRSCTNFEFYNLSEELAESSGQGVQELAKSSNGLFLTLKRVERDFLKLLRNIVGDRERVASHHSAYPLSQIPIPDRGFTISAVVAVDDVVEGRIDLDEVQIGVDAIELRISLDNSKGSADGSKSEDDFLKTAEAFATMRRLTILPVILTVAGQVSSSSSPETFARMTSYCFRLAPEYCTVDLSLGSMRLEPLLEGKGRTQVIAMAHIKPAPRNGWDDDECLEAYNTAERLDCEIAKIIMPAMEIEDSFAAHVFRQKVEAQGGKTRLIAYSTGKKGRLSMCFNNVLTPVRSPSNGRSGEIAHEEDVMVTAKDIFTSLFASFVYEPMHFFIYGANVSYSLSPAMHNAAYSACGMPHTYGTHSSSTLDDFKRLAREHHFGGAAVVQPFKTGVVPLLDGLSSHATAIGSVNTIIPVRELTSDGAVPNELRILSELNRSGPVKALYGHNTDWIGIRACLRRGLSPANTVRPQTTTLVCGAGGQARSAIYAMLSLGVRNIFVCNRTFGNAQKLAEHYNTLIDSRAISELDPANAAHTRVRVLDSFASPWPKDSRQPSMIVSGIPTQTADGTPTNFTIPTDWLRGPTGGITIEVRARYIIYSVLLIY